MRNKKIYIVLSLVLLLFSSTVMGAEVKTLNLQSAVDMALEQNLNLKEEKINLEKSQLQYEKQNANNLLTQSEYNELQAEYSLKAAKNSYKNIYDSIIKNVVNQYTNLWLSEYNLQIREKRMEVEELLLEEAKAKYEIGDIGSLDLLDQENSYEDARYNLKTSRDDYEQSLREFRTTLGIDNIKIDLEELPKINIWETNEKEVVKTSLENSINLQLKEMDLKLAKLDKKRAEISASTIDKKIKEKTVEAAEVAQKRIKRELENSSIMVYYDYLHAVEEMNLKKKSWEKSKKNYDLKEEQYNKGLITKSELLNFELTKMQSKYDYMSSIANYYNKRISLKQQMNEKLEVIESEAEKE